MSREGFGMNVPNLNAAVEFWNLLGADLVVEEDCDDRGPYAWGGLGRGLISIQETGDRDKWTRGLEICLELPCVISVMAALEVHKHPTALTVGGTLSTVSPCGGIKVIVVEPRRAQERREWEPGFGES